MSVSCIVDTFCPDGWEGSWNDSIKTIMTIHNNHTKNGVMTAPWLYGK
ncbi:MAG: hypothetical protein WBG43_08900 [Marinifilaceae bacterium]